MLPKASESESDEESDADSDYSGDEADKAKKKKAATTNPGGQNAKGNPKKVTKTKKE
jgi:hypothetical protein